MASAPERKFLQTNPVGYEIPEGVECKKCIDQQLHRFFLFCSVNVTLINVSY